MSAHSPADDSQSIPALQVPFDLIEELAWLEQANATTPSPATIWASYEDEEITIQSKRVVPDEQAVAACGNRKSEETKLSRTVRVLDEWAVLPGEASFATVKLNQEMEQPAPKLREDERVRSEEFSSSRASSQVRVLDESQVLSGEASFATVILNQPIANRSYSPVSEFLVKTNLNLKPLVLVSVAWMAVVVITASVFLVAKLMNSGASSTSTASDVSNQVPTKTRAIQNEPVDDSPKPIDSVALPEQTISLSVKEARVEGLISSQRKTDDRSYSEVSAKTSDESARSEMRIHTSLKNVTSFSTLSSPIAASNKLGKTSSRSTKAKVRETSNVRTGGVSANGDANRDSSKPVLSQSESLSPKPTEISKREPDAQTVTGGGQRPRRVTP